MKTIVAKKGDGKISSVKSSNREKLNVESSINDSFIEYSEMKVLVLQLNKTLESNTTANVAEFLINFNQLSEKTKMIDSRIISNFKSIDAPQETTEKLLRLRELQEEVKGLIKKTIIRANSIKSLLANEVNSIKTGRKAMSGYKSKSGNYGRIVNRCS